MRRRGCSVSGPMPLGAAGSTVSSGVTLGGCGAPTLRAGRAQAERPAGTQPSRLPPVATLASTSVLCSVYVVAVRLILEC